MNDQAKLLLSAYRPGGADATDPAFSEALSQAERDPQLRAWFQESQQFDQAIAEKLRSVPVPADLRNTILAGAKFSQRKSPWLRARFWAIAALFAVIASVAAMWFSKGSRLDGWQVDSLAVLDRIESGAVELDKEHPQATHLVEWLRANAAPVPASVPSVLAAHPTFGCKSIDSAGRKVSVICFDLGNEDQAHLFTTKREGLKIQPPENHAVFARRSQWNLASWSNGDSVHMLATQMEESRLRALLPNSIAVRAVSSRSLVAELLMVP